MSVTGLLLLGALTGEAAATGPGGWGHLGDAGTPGTPSLNGAVSALNADRPNMLYVGGTFTSAGGVAGADRIASWNGSAWSAVSSPSSQISNGAVNAIAYDAATGDVYAGGTFTNAGGNANADFLAVWDGTSWAPFCSGSSSPPITATVNALQIVGRTLYVAGAFADGAGIASADRLVACSLDTGAASSTVIDEAHAFSGTIYTLAADSAGNLYAGGGFTDLGGDPAADNVAYKDGSGWHSMGSGAGACSCAVNDFVRSLTAVGTDVYVGTDAQDVAGIAKADHVVRWNGSAWSAVGSNTAGSDGWFPASAFIYGMANDGTSIYATGSFQNANGDPQADFVASFDGSAWHAIGSDGAGNGPWIGNGLALAAFAQRLYAGGNFTSAGGDTQAKYAAVYPGQVTLTVRRTGTGGGNVKGSGIQCPSTCSADFPPGTTITLSVYYNFRSRFTGWSGGGCSGTGNCQVTLNSDTTVNAEFADVPYCYFVNAGTATGGVPKPLQLSCDNDTGAPITYGIEKGPSHGTLGPLSGGGQVTYTPTVGYTGDDRIDYHGTDINGTGYYASVGVKVTDPGFSHAGDNLALMLGKLTPTASGQLSLRAHNANTFAVRAVSLEVTSLAPIAAGRPRARPQTVTFLTSTKATAVGAGKTATLKGRLSGPGLALLKRLRHVRVRIRVTLKAPEGTRSFVVSKGTLHAPRP